MYFGEQEEQAVLAFSDSDCQQERSRIYREKLDKPLKIMISSIIRRYPVNLGDYSIEDLEADTLSHVVQQMGKFNPDKLTSTGQRPKAYSYLGTIARNYLKTHSTKSSRKTNQNVDFDMVADSVEKMEGYHYELDDQELEKSDQFYEYFFQVLVSVVEERLNYNENLRQKDHAVGDALVELLSRWHLLFEQDISEGVQLTNNYVKNKILYFLREHTGLDNKDIRRSTNILFPDYKDIKNRLY